ncbi:uncharacterized protein LOC18048871 isoform X3 [Citrus clementina]|uniref:uncharacterized protein LOC18048871 isoform X3 n=1 Tax=Citrus clementina TaxID=85681 RepID=UPI000CED7A83|nr:uncharacterized protein LOC18048871 isoform X3 [Citrus x clementina]
MLLTAPDCFSSSHLPFASIKNSTAAVILKRFRLNSVSQTRTSRRLCRASLITSPDSFEVGRLIGSYGFMNITSYSGLRDIEYSSGDLGRLGVQDVGEGSVKIRLYEGRIAQGPLKGTSVMFKVYPGQRTGGIEADMMAANELNAHAFLQWLAFRSDGKYSAADYAKLTSEKISKNHSAGESSWNRFETEQILKCRRYFVIKLFQGAMSGLAYMHDHDRLHQSLGPSSVILNTIVEKDAAYLVPRLRDLSFSVDISFQNLEEDPGTFSEGLWRRAAAAGAFTPMEKRAFGIADDVYEAGLLLAYLAFVTFCEANVMDSLSLQRLLESTFRLDLQATREYCLADDRLLEAVKFLDLGEGAGWELLQVEIVFKVYRLSITPQILAIYAMLNPDFQQRPIAEAVINHRFTAGAVL